MKVAVLIPTIYRPEGLCKTLLTLEKTAPKCVPVIAREVDDMKALEIAREFNVLITSCKEPRQGPGYAWNAALEYAQSYNAYFLAGDDCEFMDGWYEEVLSTLFLELDGSGLVGINDGRKDSGGIKEGRLQPTHYLMTRDFIVEHNNGLAAYPYPVDYTDVETCMIARKVNKFAYAERAYVKHNWIGTHPDETFKRNQSKRKEAKLLFAERQALGFPPDIERILV
jgi:hypothetical protein